MLAAVVGFACGAAKLRCLAGRLGRWAMRGVVAAAVVGFACGVAKLRCSAGRRAMRGLVPAAVVEFVCGAAFGRGRAMSGGPGWSWFRRSIVVAPQANCP
ncbi:hypothetical protein GCM10027258_74090 [Amycolatopsis stemonae]